MEFTESKERLELALSVTPMGFYDWYPMEDKLFWDDGMHKLTQLDPGREVDRNDYFFSIIHPDDQKKAVEYFEKIMDPQSSETEFQSHFRMLINDEVRYFQNSGLRFLDEQGKLNRLLGVMIDQTDKIIAEQKLKINQERLQLASDATGLATFDYYPNEGKIYWDKRMHDTFGLPEDSLSDRLEVFFQHLHEEDVESVRSNFERYMDSACTDQSFSSEFRIRRAGETKFISSQGLLFRDSEGNVVRVVGTQSDLTELRKTTQELRQSEEKFRSIFEDNSDHIFYVNNAGIVEFINHVTPGLTVDKVIGTRFLDLVTPSDRKMVSGKLKEVFETGKAAHYQTTFEGPEGTRYFSTVVSPNLDKGKTYGATFISRDITDLEITRRDLKESEEKFKALIESSEDSIFSIDANWRIDFINRVEPGFRKEDLIGRYILDLVSESEKEKVKIALTTVFREAQSVQYETTFEQGPTGPVYYSTNASPLVENGKVYGATFVSRDNTEAKRVEGRLIEQARALKLYNRNLEQFAYISSHDIKAPVTNLNSLLEMLEQSGAVDEKGIPILEKTRAAVEQMDKTIRTLNEVFFVQSNLDLDKEIVSFKDLLKDVEGVIENQILVTKTTLEADFSKCPTLDYPSVHLKSILQNLLTNSIKYRHPDRAPVIKLNSWRESAHVWLQIDDNGLGIDSKKYGNKMFDLFQRFHLDIEGKGMGLYIVKMIVENYGGDITFESVLNQGTRFRIDLGPTSR